MKISKFAAAIPASPTLSISAKAAALKAQGVDVISFSAGEPDFTTPLPIVESAKAALDAGRTKYTPVGGAPQLKAAIRAEYQRRLGIEFSDAEIIVSSGAKHSLYNAFSALLDEGDEVIIPAPYWVSYPAQVELAGGKAVTVSGSPQNGFVPTIEALDAAVTDRTVAIVINNPTNPTGALWDADAIRGIAAWLERHPKITVISDAIYDELVYDGAEAVELLSVAPSLRDRYVLINGFSKAYAMTGWRLGYAIAPKEFVSAMARLQSQSTSNANSITQFAAITALECGQEVIKPMRDSFQERRDIIYGLLSDIDGLEVVEPKGAFYIFPDASALIGKTADGIVMTSDMVMAEWLLESAQIAVVPGSPFGAPGFFRMSYASSEASIREGCKRLATALAKLK